LSFLFVKVKKHQVQTAKEKHSSWTFQTLKPYDEKFIEEEAILHVAQ
jgi:hypothetical protein